MVKIRLSRGGAKRQPFYHIIVTDSRNKRDGRNIERLGFFNPVARGGSERLRVDIERVDHWLGIGAHMSERVRDLVAQARAARTDEPAAAEEVPAPEAAAAPEPAPAPESAPESESARENA